MQIHPKGYDGYSYKLDASLIRMIRYVGWPLLLLHFFLKSFWREQVLALQTLICASDSVQPYHAATIVILFVNLVENVEKVENVELGAVVQMILHLLVVGSAVLMEYYQKYIVIGWVGAAWSVRWLGSINLYLSPERSCLRCLVFLLVANWQRKWSKTEEGMYRKVVWILIVHEIMWCILPVQILYEIYFNKDVEKKESEQVV